MATRPGADARAVASEHAEGRVGRFFSRTMDGFVADLSAAEVEQLTDDRRVQRVERDLPIELEASGTQADPPWNLDRLDQRNLPLDRTFSRRRGGEGTEIYIVDSGINAAHVTLAGRVRSGFDASGGDSDDCHGHGTQVASVAAGRGLGVADSANLVSVKVLGCDGTGTVSDVIAGLEWILGDRSPSSLPGVVNLSLSSGVSETLDEAVTTVSEAGLLVVAAAGNQSGDACGRSPARASQVLTVAGSTASDGVWRFSNTGPCVDVFAPAEGVVAATTGAEDAVAVVHGTSLAAPHLSGIAARFIEEHGGGWSGAGLAAALRHLATSDALTGVPPDTDNRMAHSSAEELDAGTVGTAPHHITAASTAFGSTSSETKWRSDRNGCVTSDGRLTAAVTLPAGAVVTEVEVQTDGPDARGVLSLIAASESAPPRADEVATVSPSGEASALSRTYERMGARTYSLLWDPGDERPPTALCHVRLGFRLADAGGASTLHALPACPLFDTRSGRGGIERRVREGEVLRVAVDGDLSSQGGSADGCGVPADATAISLHLVATGPVDDAEVAAGELAGSPAVLHVSARGRDSLELPVAVLEDRSLALRVTGGAVHLRGVVLGYLGPYPVTQLP